MGNLFHALALVAILQWCCQMVTASPTGPMLHKRDSAMAKLACMDSSSCSRDANTKTVSCTFTLRNETFNANGTPRTMQLVNGQFPGPCIQAMLNDHIQVKVINEPPTDAHSSQNVSIHWHGLHQTDSAIYDGTPLTQCPLKANSSMTYYFPADEAGTHMWHSHYKLSLLDGVWGPLIVHDDNDPYLGTYDEERVISLTDFANETAVSQFAHWKESELAYYYSTTPKFDVNYNPYPGDWWFPGPANDGHGDYYNWTYGVDGALVGVIPWVGGLINGKTLNSSDPAVIQVEANTTYRLRLLSPSAFYALEFSIDGHQFDVIAADGTSLTQTGPYDYLNIHAGERYDLILKTGNTKPGDRYWIRARTMEKDLPWHQVLAILSYGDNQTTPLPQQDLYKGNVTGTRWANCFHDIGPDCIPASEFVPYPNSTLPSLGVPNVTSTLYLKFIHGPLINGVRYAEPESPPIFSKGNVSVLPGIWPCADNTTYAGCTSQFGCNCTQSMNLEYNQQVRLTLMNLWPSTAEEVTGVHPFHLHGHKFAVLGMGWNGPFTDAQSTSLNMVNPSWRDDLIIPAGGWAVIQFVADNPGTWMGHCHMLHHENDGMVIMFAEALDWLKDLTPPPDFPYCNEWDTTIYEGTIASLPKYPADPALFPVSASQY